MYSNYRSTSLASVVRQALPALSGSQLTYNAEKNLYLTTGYTSAAGNTYFRAIRMSNRLAIFFNVGIGYAHTFLNGITLYCWDGSKPVMISQKTWGGCNNWCTFNEAFAKRQCISMLTDYLRGQLKLTGTYVSDRKLIDDATSIIEDANRKRLD